MFKYIFFKYLDPNKFARGARNRKCDNFMIKVASQLEHFTGMYVLRIFILKGRKGVKVQVKLFKIFIKEEGGESLGKIVGLNIPKENIYIINHEQQKYVK